MNFLDDYYASAAERAEQGIPPLPLTDDQTKQVIDNLTNPAFDDPESKMLSLLAERVPPGVDPAAKVKADFLARIAADNERLPVLPCEKAVELLGTMLGGYNVPCLVHLLDDVATAHLAAEALKKTVLVFDNFDDVLAKAERGNRLARQVVESWGEAEWFTSRPDVPEEISLRVFRVDGEINTDDLSPAKHAPTRPDIPLHALAMGEARFPGGVEKIAAWRAEGHRVAFVGHTVGTGSSRKSAANSLIWHIGEDIPYVPNKRQGGVVIGEAIAPIFFNTLEDAGALPIRVESIDKIEHGEMIVVRPKEGMITSGARDVLAEFSLAPITLADEMRAGGRLTLIIGRTLTARARKALAQEASTVFTLPPAPEPEEGQGYTLAQKLVGRACGKDGVLPGETCEPATSTVGSQDTTGPMTKDELVELACLSFQADLVMQSFCHTAAYPTDRDTAMHKTLPNFISDRGGVALKPGDGIIHSWLNRLLLPDTVGTGGDSHTRFPLGISFPAGSGLVAFAAALGCMPLDMPESVLVRFTGKTNDGITLRDVVNAIPLAAVNKGLQSKYGSGSKNVFNSRILEMEGLPGLAVEQAFELTCAAAERSAAAATIALEEDAVTRFLKSNVALIKRMIADGYKDAATLEKRMRAIQDWLREPSLLKRDETAKFAAELEFDLAAIDEPVLACPNNPDNVETLSSIAGTAVDEVFIGSCMTNISHFRAAAKILAAAGETKVKRLWITPPTRMDRKVLESEGLIDLFESVGARVEIPGCSLCMGNQARVDDKSVVVSTSTRNFDNRMGAGAQVYLASAELAAITAATGALPDAETYFKQYAEHVQPDLHAINTYLAFDELSEDVVRLK